ncbi:MAG: class I SAM-dependent methyltransferase [Elusimicrobiota bacterium]
MSEPHSEFYERWSKAARPYFDWQFEQFAPFVGRRAVDVGCGLGSFVPNFMDHGVEGYWGVEPDEDLRRRFSERHRDPRVRLTETTDATDPRLAEEMKALGADTAFSVNVIEHIERDDLALRNMIAGVKPGGHLCLLVPAHPFLYGSLDALDHHFRRYTKKTFLDLVSRAGGENVAWVDLHYFNALASFGWFLKGRILKETKQEDENWAVMNMVLPFVSRAEKLIRPPFGLSLVAILRRL